MAAIEEFGTAGPLPLPLNVKPRLRGWLHAYAAVFSVVSGVTLISVTGALRGHGAALATSVYALSVTGLFTTSALYHRISWQARGHSVMKRLDHSMIFVFIAGTYTPIAAFTLPRDWAVAVLAVVWGGAAAGVALKATWPDAPRWLSVPCYIGLGWVAVAVFPKLAHAGLAALVLVAAGGVLYTFGAVVYALRRPDPKPTVFGFHEVFHLCTLVAAICHYIAIWLAVLH